MRRNKALAMYVQSHNCSFSSIMLLFISQHVNVAILNEFVAVLKNVKFLRSGNPSRNNYRPRNHTCPSKMLMLLFVDVQCVGVIREYLVCIMFLATTIPTTSHLL